MNTFQNRSTVRNTLQPIALENLRSRVPSIFAEHPSEAVSNRYTFIPTTRVIDVLGAQGWLPVKAEQCKVRRPGNLDFTKHMIRFQNSQVGEIDGEEVPEIILTNAHNAVAAYCLSVGIFRFVCSNGLIVADATFASIKIRHSGFTDDAIIEATARVADSVPKLGATVRTMKQIELSSDEQLAFAKSAKLLKFDEDAPVDPAKLLTSRRSTDEAPSLWNSYNRVQENLVRGGIRTFDKETGRRNKTRAITSINEDSRVTKALWTLAAEMARIKGVALAS